MGAGASSTTPSGSAPIACRRPIPAANSFRERYLRVDEVTGFDAARWNHAGVATALQPSCVHDAAGWTCSCPADAPPEPGRCRSASIGCTGIHACASTPAASPAWSAPSRSAAAASRRRARHGSATDSSAQLEVMLALLPGTAQRAGRGADGARRGRCRRGCVRRPQPGSAFGRHRDPRRRSRSPPATHALTSPAGARQHRRGRQRRRRARRA